MPKFILTITRISTAEVEVEINAPDRGTAQTIGYQIAGNQDFPASHFAEFEILPENIHESPDPNTHHPTAEEPEQTTIPFSLTSPYCPHCDEADIAIDDSECWNCGMPLYNC